MKIFRGFRVFVCALWQKKNNKKNPDNAANQ